MLLIETKQIILTSLIVFHFQILFIVRRMNKFVLAADVKNMCQSMANVMWVG